MIATANAVRFIGAEPKFVDIDCETLCLDVDKTHEALDNSVTAIIHVALNGRSSDVKSLKGIVPVIEDSCQAFGSYCDGYPSGTIGEIGVYSLSPHKIITTGQGGIVVTNDFMLYERIKRLKDFGRCYSEDDETVHFGINSKFTDFQAVIGIEQIKRIKQRISRKCEIYDRYF
jgi:perosamine synthetase